MSRGSLEATAVTDLWVMSCWCADIEDRKVRLLLRMAEDKKQLQEIEAKILKMLSESTGNILDDEELINTLANSKYVSQ